MAFEVAYSLQGDVLSPAKDFPLDAAYGTPNKAIKGDLVTLTAGLAKRTASAGGTATGVLVGREFMGLVPQGQEYAATNASITAANLANANGTGKIILDKSIVYRVSGSATATKANIGKSYAILTNGTTGDQTVNLALETTPSVKVVDISPDGAKVFVTLV